MKYKRVLGGYQRAAIELITVSTENAVVVVAILTVATGLG
jgi:hypothetical protein